MADPCAASLSVTRLPPRPDSYRHSFRCKARGRARLFGPAGQPAPAGECARRVSRQSSTEPTGRRSYRMGLSKRVRSYERTCVPAWQTQPTNSGHGLPDGHLHGACLPPWPHWDVSERRWLYPESRARVRSTAEGQLCYAPTGHGPGEPSGALGRPRGGPPWPSGGWTDPRARGRNPRHGKGVNQGPRAMPSAHLKITC